MISRMSDPNHGIAIITSGNEEDTDIQYCPNCSEFRKKNVRLCPLITLEGEVPPPDAGQFKQCPSCYMVIPIYDVREEGILFTDLEPIKHPPEFGVTKIEGINNKTLKNQVKKLKQRKRKEEFSDDQEVMNEVKQGAVVTSYYSTI